MRYQIARFLGGLAFALTLFCPEAYAQPFSFINPAIMDFFPIIVVFGLMYFLILRPQSKKAKQHREMLHVLRRGDRVLTAGGIVGTVSKIENDQEVLVDIAENVTVRIAKGTLVQVLAKTEPVKTGSVSPALQDNQEHPKGEEVHSPQKKTVKKSSSLPKKGKKTV